MKAAQKALAQKIIAKAAAAHACGKHPIPDGPRRRMLRDHAQIVVLDHLGDRFGLKPCSLDRVDGLADHLCERGVEIIEDTDWPSVLAWWREWAGINRRQGEPKAPGADAVELRENLEDLGIGTRGRPKRRPLYRRAA